MNTLRWPPLLCTERATMLDVKRYLGIEGIAELADITQATVRSYKRYNRLPEPDVLIDGKHAGWEEATVLAWMGPRPLKPGPKPARAARPARAPRSAAAPAAARPA